MRRAGRGDVEIGGNSGISRINLHQAAMAGADRMRLALVLDRAAHFVGARKAVDVGAMVG